MGANFNPHHPQQPYFNEEYYFYNSNSNPNFNSNSIPIPGSFNNNFYVPPPAQPPPTPPVAAGGIKFFHSKENRDYFNSLPPGCRFCPTDIELIHYLKLKKNKLPLPFNKIHQANIYEYSPHDISKLFEPTTTTTTTTTAAATAEGNKESESEWYFFTQRERKYRNGKKPNRAAGKTGYWRASAAVRPIIINNQEEENIIGYRRSLVFHYHKKNPSSKYEKTKTDWLMHEYFLNNDEPRKRTSPLDMRLDDDVLCKIYYHQKGNKKDDDEVDSSDSSKTLIFQQNTIDGGNDQPQLVRPVNSVMNNYVVMPNISNTASAPAIKDYAGTGYDAVVDAGREDRNFNSFNNVNDNNYNDLFDFDGIFIFSDDDDDDNNNNKRQKTL